MKNEWKVFKKASLMSPFYTLCLIVVVALTMASLVTERYLAFVIGIGVGTGLLWLQLMMIFLLARRDSQLALVLATGHIGIWMYLWAYLQDSVNIYVLSIALAGYVYLVYRNRDRLNIVDSIVGITNKRSGL